MDTVAEILAGSNAEQANSPKSDFISDYASYADILEAPRMMHEAMADA